MNMYLQSFVTFIVPYAAITAVILLAYTCNRNEKLREDAYPAKERRVLSEGAVFIVDRADELLALADSLTQFTQLPHFWKDTIRIQNPKAYLQYEIFTKKYMILIDKAEETTAKHDKVLERSRHFPVSKLEAFPMLKEVPYNPELMIADVVQKRKENVLKLKWYYSDILYAYGYKDY